MVGIDYNNKYIQLYRYYFEQDRKIKDCKWYEFLKKRRLKKELWSVKEWAFCEGMAEAFKDLANQ